MKEKEQLIKIFTGTELTVLTLKGFLEEIGVNSRIQNNYKSGIDAGYYGGVPSAIDLYIRLADFDKAEPIIRDFIANNK
jgi:hypothetical protein